eukprot:COSAG01_NODE_49_length_31891_cov_29.945773_26_plen_79_part_00
MAEQTEKRRGAVGWEMGIGKLRRLLHEVCDRTVLFNALFSSPTVLFPPVACPRIAPARKKEKETILCSPPLCFRRSTG